MIKEPDKIKKFIEKALTKQFACVGKKYTEKQTKADNWYLKYSWDKKQQTQFKSWFLKNIKKDFKLTKNKAESEYQYWNLMWGWKDKEL